MRYKGGKITVCIILSLVKLGHIHPRKLRQGGQALLLAALGINNVQNALHRFLTLANNKGVSHGRQRLRVKGGTRPAHNHQRLALVALSRTQADIAQVQHSQQIVIIHLKRQHDKDYIKIGQCALGFQAQQRRFAFAVLCLQAFIRQKETLAGTVTPGVNHLV